MVATNLADAIADLAIAEARQNRQEALLDQPAIAVERHPVFVLEAAAVHLEARAMELSREFVGPCVLCMKTLQRPVEERKIAMRHGVRNDR